MGLISNFYFGWFLYNIICVSLLMVMFKRINDRDYTMLLNVYTVLCIIFALFGNSISPDFTSYRDIVKEVAATKEPFTHIESVYISIIHEIGNNLWLFQCCIFIPQFLLIWLIFTKYVKLRNSLLFIAFFSIVCLFSTIVGRYYLFISFFLLGCILVAKNKKIIGILLIIISFFLHKAAILAIPIAMLSFFKLHLTYRRAIVFFTLYFVVIIVCRHLLQNSLDELYLGLGNLEGKDYIMKKEGINAGGSLWWQFIYLFQNFVKYTLSISCLYYLRQEYIKYDRVDMLMYNLILWTVLISGFFYLIGLPDNTIAGRILGIGLIPSCYLFSQEKRLMLKAIPKYMVSLAYVIYLILTNAYIVGVSRVNGI